MQMQPAPKSIVEIAREPFPKEPMARRRQLTDSLDILFEMYRNEGMSDAEIRDTLHNKLRTMTEAEQDAA